MPRIFIIHYYTMTFISIIVIIFTVINIEKTLNTYNEASRDIKSKSCICYYYWKLSLFFNIFLFCVFITFLLYLLYRRRKNYNDVIYLQIGPLIDRTIILIILCMSFLFGPCLLFQVIIMIIYYNDIFDKCKYNINDPIKTIFIPYIIICIMISISMIMIMISLFFKKCSRRNLMRERNIYNVLELINII